MKKLLLFLFLIGCTYKLFSFRQINTLEYLELRRMVNEYPNDLRNIYHEYYFNDNIIDVMEFEKIKKQYEKLVNN